MDKVDSTMLANAILKTVPGKVDDCGICPKCGKPTRAQIVALGRIITVPVMCACEEAAYKAEKAEAEHRENMLALERMRSSSMMDEAFRDSRFEDSIIDDSNQTPMRYAKKYVEHFDEMLDKNRGLLFWGPPGTGKTHLAACIANALLDKGVSVLMTSFVRINGASFNEDDDDNFIQRMKRAKLLIIDDLGAERDSSYSLERVYNVIDSRTRSKLPMILTTNLSLNQMRETGDTRLWRIYDRIFQTCLPVEFKGQSFRRIEARRNYNEVAMLFEDESW